MMRLVEPGLTGGHGLIKGGCSAAGRYPDLRPARAKLQVGARAAAALLENGVIGRAMPHADILGFAPPLIITRQEVDVIVEATAKAVETTYSALKAEGAL